MSERPILFSTEMVQSLLRGSKTQTRRVIKPQPDHRHCRLDFEDGLLKESSRVSGCWSVGRKTKCPYGQPGDILWVRETCVRTVEDGYLYKADYKDTEPIFEKWRPSIHMPRVAARIFLRVKDVRVERLTAITGKDVLAEGVDNGKSNPTMGERWENMQRMAFQELWDSINGKWPGCAWKDSPWVWVVSFERI